MKNETELLDKVDQVKDCLRVALEELQSMRLASLVKTSIKAYKRNEKLMSDEDFRRYRFLQQLEYHAGEVLNLSYGLKDACKE